jgi:hypothetical protein
MSPPIVDWYIEGIDDRESRRLLDDLLAHTTRPECVYQHHWRQWDLVMWDNRCVLHGRSAVGRRAPPPGDAPHDRGLRGPDGRAAVRHGDPGVGWNHPGGRRRRATTAPSQVVEPPA